ncbi:hypothetical protein HY024_04945 [Candidatus Curtissbacteria bacterium]|nr:hypothetical protein [Candidatus Curtissbacteria bacterium]
MVPLAAVGMLFINISKKLFLLPAFVIFILANVIIFQPWAWDNIKLLSWSFVFFSILCAVTLGKLQRYGQMGVFLTICIVATFALPGVLSLTHQTRGEFVIYDRDDIALGDWLKTNTKDSEVFVSDPTPNNPIPSLGRRMLYLGYPGHLWVHGIDYSQREILNNEFLKGNFSNISNVDVAISYIVVSKNDGFGSNNNIKKIYENTKYKVYKL